MKNKNHFESITIEYQNDEKAKEKFIELILNSQFKKSYISNNKFKNKIFKK